MSVPLNRQVAARRQRNEDSPLGQLPTYRRDWKAQSFSGSQGQGVEMDVGVISGPLLNDGGPIKASGNFGIQCDKGTYLVFFQIKSSGVAASFLLTLNNVPESVPQLSGNDIIFNKVYAFQEPTTIQLTVNTNSPFSVTAGTGIQVIFLNQSP